eukprot:symbB.v1.2.029239.t1/scaffold3175.1/size97379/6
MAQRARQVRGAVASAKEATEKLVRVMTSLRQAGSAAPKLHEEVKQLELEERQAAISKWWTQKRWQERTGSPRKQVRYVLLGLGYACVEQNLANLFIGIG